MGMFYRSFFWYTSSLIFLFFMTATVVNAQFYETGQAPASVKWKQINTGNFRLIFPASFESRAGRMAALLEESRSLTGHTLSHQPGSIPVVIHNHNARSNGMVVWAPKRMEIYPVPPQSARGVDWLKHLAVHEQRHVVQVDKLDQGLTSLLGFLLGEQATGIAVGRMPLWLIEGDAVTTETLLTRAGRGRMARFEMPLRTLLLSDSGIYSYDKFLFGSYRDFVPNHYQYGYQMVSALRRDYGTIVWDNTLDFIGRWPVHPAPLASSLKRETGQNLTDLHQTVMKGIREEWDSLAAVYESPDPANPRNTDRYHTNRGHVYPDGSGQQKTTPGSNDRYHDSHAGIIRGGRTLNVRSNGLYQSYNYPVWEGDSAVIAVKSGIAQTDEFVRVDMKGNEESLRFPGTLSSPSFTMSGRRIAWSEYRSDIRWGLRQYSVLKVYDMDTGRERRISHQTRYFSPAFAPDGLFLAVIEVDMENRQSILLVNSVTGEVVSRFPGPVDQSLQLPVFHPDGGEIFMTSVGCSGTSIISLDLDTGEWIGIVEPDFVNISGLFPCGQMVCFSSDMAGIDNLFAIDREDGSLYMITGSTFGAFDGSISSSGGLLAWSDYTAKGFDLAVAPFDGDLIKPYDGRSFSHDKMIQKLALDEKGIMGAGSYDTTQWQAERYRKGLNLFRFHSRAPFYYDYSELNIEQQPVYPGVTLLSQNLLNTANTLLGYSFREGRHIAHGSFIWKGWYPVMEAGFDYGDRPGVFQGRDTIGPSDNGNYGLLNIRGLVYLPLNLSDGRWIARFEPRLRISYNNSLYHYDSDDNYKRGMTIIEKGILAARYQKSSVRDLAPRWGQVFRWRRRSAPFETENLGVINAVELTMYAPGLLPHHSLRFEAALQSQDPMKYYYGSLVSFPRGYQREKSEHLRVFSSTYSFPLAYPDFAIPGILYIKRVHALLFADFGDNRLRVEDPQTNRREWQEENLFSFGCALTANFHLLRMVFPFSMSGGFAHLPERDRTSFLFNFGVNLNIF